MCSHQQNTNTFLAEMCLCVIQKCVYSDPVFMCQDRNVFILTQSASLSRIIDTYTHF